MKTSQRQQSQHGLQVVSAPRDAVSLAPDAGLGSLALLDEVEHDAAVELAGVEDSGADVVAPLGAGPTLVASIDELAGGPDHDGRVEAGPVLTDRFGQSAHVVGDDTAAGLHARVSLVEGDVLLQKAAFDIARRAIEQGSYGLRERGLIVPGRQDEVGPSLLPNGPMKMFYLCSIGSNLDPHRHVSQAIGEILDRFGCLQLSSVIQTKPVGIKSRHDFLNCLFITECTLTLQHLKTFFVAMELAHGRDRSNPDCKILDRPLDIDILASNKENDFSATQVDVYLNELLAELHGQGEVHDQKVMLLLHARLMSGKVIEERKVGLTPLYLDASRSTVQNLAQLV